MKIYKLMKNYKTLYHNYIYYLKEQKMHKCGEIV